MRINRNLAAAMAITVLLIAGVVGWQISDADQATQVQPKAELTASATPTASQEPAEILEDPNPKKLTHIWKALIQK